MRKNNLVNSDLFSIFALQLNKMRKIFIKKNGKTVRTITTTDSKFQKEFNKAHDIAGGMWNGVDVITVVTV